MSGFRPLSSCLLHTGLPSSVCAETILFCRLSLKWALSKSFQLRPCLLPFLSYRGTKDFSWSPCLNIFSTVLNSHGEDRRNVRKPFISSAHTTTYCHRVILVAKPESELYFDGMLELLRLCWCQHKSSWNTICHHPFHPSLRSRGLKLAHSIVL